MTPKATVSLEELRGTIRADVESLCVESNTDPKWVGYVMSKVDAYREAAVMAERWRPIDSAPKDDYLLGLMPNKLVYVICWAGGVWRTNPTRLMCQPTHFMPIPDPPGTEAVPGEGQ